MSRGWITFLLICGLGSLAAAAYFGFASVQPDADAPPPAPVTVAVTQGTVEKTVTAPGQLVGTGEVVLTLPVNGRLTSLNVRPGSRVTAGEILAQLDPTPFEDALTLAQLALTQAEAEQQQQLRAAELQAENSSALVNSTRAQTPSLTAAEIRLAQAHDYENRAAYEYQKALDRTWEPPEVAEAYARELAAATAEREIAEAELQTLQQQQWAVAQQAEALATGVEQAETTLAYLSDHGVDPLLPLAVTRAERELAATTLTAPFDGVVLEVRVRPGETIAAGQSLLLLADPSAVEVRTTVIEEDIPLTQVSNLADMFFDAQPDLPVSGRVSRIVPQRVAGEERPLYHVYLSLETRLPDGVFPGMTVDAAIIIEREEEALRLPRGLVRTRSDGSATVEVWANGRATERIITTGLRGDAYVEILSGLSLGEAVIAE